MTTENDKKQPVQWPSQPIEKVHIHCGTPECCGECSTPDKDEEKSISAYGHLRRKIYE